MIQRTNGVIHNIQKFLFCLGKRHSPFIFCMVSISDNVINYTMQGARFTSAYPWGGIGGPIVTDKAVSIIIFQLKANCLIATGSMNGRSSSYTRACNVPILWTRNVESALILTTSFFASSSCKHCKVNPGGLSELSQRIRCDLYGHALALDTRTPAPGIMILNFWWPVLAHHYYILNLSDPFPSVDKKWRRNIAFPLYGHAPPQQPLPQGSGNLQFW